MVPNVTASGGQRGRQERTLAVRGAAEALSKLLKSVQTYGGEGDFDSLVSDYVEGRRDLSHQFRQLAQAELVPTGRRILDETKMRIVEEMWGLFDERVPRKYLRVEGYTGVHPVLLAYLERHEGQWISAAVLRMLTGDQVHTERRVRELRDLGFELLWDTLEAGVHYRLASGTPDLKRSARYQLEHNLKNDRTLNATTRILYLLKAELGRPVKTQRLKELSGGQTQYDRRIRELRERYDISTGLNRADISPDEYLLESLEERDPRKRFSATVQKQIFERDEYRCQACGWHKSDPQRGGRRYLEADHVVPFGKGGASIVGNGITLCNVCHDAKHSE